MRRRFIVAHVSDIRWEPDRQHLGQPWSLVVVTSAQISSGNAVSLQIRGSADHPHTVELTAGEVQQIGAGARVSKTSGFDVVHDHVVTFN